MAPKRSSTRRSSRRKSSNADTEVETDPQVAVAAEAVKVEGQGVDVDVDVDAKADDTDVKDENADVKAEDAIVKADEADLKAEDADLKAEDADVKAEDAGGDVDVKAGNGEAEGGKLDGVSEEVELKLENSSRRSLARNPKPAAESDEVKAALPVKTRIDSERKAKKRSKRSSKRATGEDVDGSPVEKKTTGEKAGRRPSSKRSVGRVDEETVEESGGAGSEKDGDGVPDGDEAERLAKAKEEALATLFGASDRNDIVEKEKPPAAKRNRGPQRERNADEVRDVDAVRSDRDDEVFEYVAAPLDVPDDFGEFSDVMARFAASGQPDVPDDEEGEESGGYEQDGKVGPVSLGKGERLNSDGENVGDTGGVSDGVGDLGSSAEPAPSPSKGNEAAVPTLSERHLRRKKRFTVAQLKALVPEPGVVEQWDVTATDPLLLVHLKSLPDAVAVPSNWRQKRKYLQGKRGMEKLPFAMPQFIVDTGICAARDALAEKDAAKTAKQKGRERIRPKSSANVDIDYGAMRDAFFKFQTKPRLTDHGDLYYELREREVQHEKFRPGVISGSLREALGVGPNDPPPWLVAMQRYGPPPAYPGLEIPGLTCPIPAGARFGFQTGGWGKPPVDENGRPLYGDVFGEGAQFGADESKYALTSEEKEWLWGEPEPAGDLDEGEDVGAAAARKRHRYNKDTEEDVANEDASKGKSETDTDNAAKTADSGAAESDAGVQSVPPGVETPASGIELRKGLAPGQLFSVLEQKETSVGKGVMGSSHVYKIGNETPAETPAGVSSQQAAGTASEKSGDALLKKRKAGPGEDARKAKKAKEVAKAKDFKF